MENIKLIEKAIGYIQNNPKENLSLQSIADNAGFSLAYFDTIFRQYTGYSPVEYSRVYKLTRSALELRKVEKTVLDIALEFGYSSPESFTRAFKKFYDLTPSEYREKYSNKPINWHDLSGMIAISHFKRTYPELKVSDIDLALDFCFTHNPLKYSEDIINMTTVDSEILTLGDPTHLEHFVYVSDYDSVEPAIMLVCENEADAISYLKLFAKNEKCGFGVRRSVDIEWNEFEAEAARLGLNSCNGYDMVYLDNHISVPDYSGMSVRLLREDDMYYINAFKQGGGCAECHVKAIQLAFSGRGNVGMKPLGLFENGELVCLAMPSPNHIRELKKYDIGAIFVLNARDEEKAIEMIWKYAIDMCLKDGATIGNANALEDTTPLGVSASERIGLVKISKNCGFFR